MLSTIWEVSALVAFLLQTCIILDGCLSLSALRTAGRNGAARSVGLHHIRADTLRLVILSILVILGPRLPLDMLERWVAWSLIVVIWITLLIALMTLRDRRKLLRML